MLARILVARRQPDEVAPHVGIADPLDPGREPATDIAASRHGREIVELRQHGFLRARYRPLTIGRTRARMRRQRLQNPKAKGGTADAAAGKAEGRPVDAVEPPEYAGADIADLVPTLHCLAGSLPELVRCRSLIEAADRLQQALVRLLAVNCLHLLQEDVARARRSVLEMLFPEAAYDQYRGEDQQPHANGDDALEGDVVDEPLSDGRGQEQFHQRRGRRQGHFEQGEVEWQQPDGDQDEGGCDQTAGQGNAHRVLPSQRHHARGQAHARVLDRCHADSLSSIIRFGSAWSDAIFRALAPRVGLLQTGHPRSPPYRPPPRPIELGLDDAPGSRHALVS